MLNEYIGNNKLKANAVIGFYPCGSVGDDIYLFPPEVNGKPIATLYGLRQQSDKEVDQPCLCLSDFIKPLENGKPGTIF